MELTEALRQRRSIRAFTSRPVTREVITDILGTCIEDHGILYPDVFRAHTGIPETKRLIIAVALGYPDLDFPANHVRSDREPVENLPTWVR